MDHSSTSDAQSSMSTAEQQLIERFRRLQADWQRALLNKASVDHEAFVAAALESEREILRQFLQSTQPIQRSRQEDADSNVTGSYQLPREQYTDSAAIQGGNTPSGDRPGLETMAFLPETTVDLASTHQKSDPDATTGASTAAAPVGSPGCPAGYKILSVLGRGGMGVVYKARQPGLKRIVALKMILAGDHADEDEVARFRVEAQAAAQLQHANIVQVYEVGEEDGRPFLALEYVDGGSLKDRLRSEPQPAGAAAQLVQVLAEAMDCAHRNGVVHRDLKPSNIMLMAPRLGGSTRSTVRTPSLVEELYGTPKIADFGLAKRLEDDSGRTRSGTILGTPSYMAPEQALGEAKHVGPLSDQYSLGAILYELLTGRPPFQGTSVWDTIEQVRNQEPVPPSRLQPKVPRDLRPFV